MLTNKEKSLIELLEPQAAEHDIEIVTVEVIGAKKSPTIRVYIDSEGGISFDELSSSQVWINQVMDEHDPFPGAYTLEVSSPGIDRPLRKPEHFIRFAGETVVLSTQKPINGRGKWTGKLIGVEGDSAIIEVDGNNQAIAFDNIKRAHIKGTIDFKS